MFDQTFVADGVHGTRKPYTLAVSTCYSWSCYVFSPWHLSSLRKCYPMLS
jgi:hypothetical protein